MQLDQTSARAGTHAPASHTIARWALSLVFGMSNVLLLTAAQNAQAAGTQQKTVCSITINSDDEIKAMKAALSPQEFRFVELTEMGEDDKDTSKDKSNRTESERGEQAGIKNGWLRRSCQSGIRCDVLVVSGHFGGKFFGSSGMSLPLEEMEMAACDASCDGIFHHPKEVFLFGCNTLAGKERDHRTPEEYLRDLLNDGLDRAQAEAAVAFRYSPIGNSFHERMARTFATVPRIYGFSSASPLGGYSGPLLKNYLYPVAPRYTDYLTSITTETNQTLINAFRPHPIAQTKGATSERSPVCFINDPRSSHLGKLSYIQDVLSKGGILEVAPYLVTYFKGLPVSKLTVPEREKLTSIRNNKKAADDLMAIASRPIRGLLLQQVDILNLMLTLGWMSKTDYEATTGQIVLSGLYAARSIDYSLRDQLCSLELRSIESMDPHRIPPQLWKESGLYNVIACLKPKNPEMALALLQNYKSQPPLAQIILAAMGDAGIQHPQVTDFLLDRMVTPTNPTEALLIAHYFKKIDLRQPEVIQTLQQVLAKEPNADRKEALSIAAHFLGRDIPSIILPSLNAGLRAQQASVAESIFKALAPSAKQSELIAKALKAKIENPASELELTNAIHAMRTFELKYPEVLPRLKSIAESKSSVQLRAIAIRALHDFNNQDQNFRAWIDRLIKSDSPAEARYVALMTIDARQAQERPGRLLDLFLAEKDGYLAETMLVKIQETVEALKNAPPGPQRVQRDAFYFDPRFAQALNKAIGSGVVNMKTMAEDIQALMRGKN